jgi:hypothetical protein
MEKSDVTIFETEERGKCVAKAQGNPEKIKWFFKCDCIMSRFCKEVGYILWLS